MGSTIIYAIHIIYIKILLLLIAIAVTVHLLKIPTFHKKKTAKLELKKEFE